MCMSLALYTTSSILNMRQSNKNKQYSIVSVATQAVTKYCHIFSYKAGCVVAGKTPKAYKALIFVHFPKE